MEKPNYNFDRSKETPKKEYFSGSNVRVYFGDVWMDQVAAISFSLQEQVAPIYGFHSHTFDRISRGSRIVQGSFSLNFTENGYLQSVLDSLASKEKSQGVLSNPRAQAQPMTHKDSDQTIQTILQAGSSGTYTDYITSLKDSFWGQSTPTLIGGYTPNKDKDAYFYADRWDEEAGAMTQNAMKEHGFNILIDYSPDANYTDFGQCLRNIKSNGSLLQTYRTIIGVHITGVSEQIGNNGQVLQQHYEFMARDLDGDITKDSLASSFLYDFETLNSYQLGGAKGAIGREYGSVNGTLGSGSSANSGSGSQQTSYGGGTGAGGGGGGGSRGPASGGGGGGGAR